MSEQATGQQGERVVYERCLCREVVEHLQEAFLPKSEAAREHLRNSRIEFLKAIRSVIDARIDHLAASGPQQGTKVNVE